MDFFKSVFFCIILIFYSFDYSHAIKRDVLTQEELKTKYTLSANIEDRISTGTNGFVIFGTKNPEPSNETILKVAIKVEKSSFLVSQPVANDIDVHIVLNKKYGNCLKKHLSHMLEFCTSGKEMVMPRYGLTLQEYLGAFKTFSHTMFRRLATHLLTAIEALHEAEFTHGDMHLNNVIFGLEDDPKDGENRMEYATYKSDFFLIDFGDSQKYIKNGTHIEKSSQKTRSRRDDMISIGRVLMGAITVWISKRDIVKGKEHVMKRIGRKVKDKDILKDFEAYLDALEELLRDYHSYDAFCRTPNYRRMIDIFGHTEEH